MTLSLQARAIYEMLIALPRWIIEDVTAGTLQQRNGKDKVE